MLKWTWIFFLPLSIYGQDSLSISYLSKENPSIFDKVEIGIELPISLNIKIKNFFNESGRGGEINPFNPDDIKIWAEFISPTNDTIRRNAFFFQD